MAIRKLLVLAIGVASASVSSPVLAQFNDGRQTKSTIPKLGRELRLGAPATGHFGGWASISADQHVVREGQPLTVESLFHCDSGSERVYDPFFCAGDGLRASLRVFDASEQFLGNVLSNVAFDVEPHQRWVGHREWTIMGRAVRVDAAGVTSYAAGTGPTDGDRALIASLGEGKYVIQLVLFWRFIDPRNASNDAPELRPNARGYPEPTGHEEICRSNVLEIEVLPRGPTGQGGQYNDAGTNGAPYKAKLTIENPRFPPERMKFRILTYNTGAKPVTLFNPLLSGLNPIKTADLFLFDHRGDCVGSLFETGPQDGSSTIGQDDWLTVPPGGIVGAKSKVWHYRPIDAAPLREAAYAQMVFYDTSVSQSSYLGLRPANPFADPPIPPDPRLGERWKQWREEHPGKELFRSNVVDIVDAEGKMGQ